MSVERRPAAERYRSSLPGVLSWHCFSAGAHYHPDNLGFGPLIGLDEHTAEPGAGFTRHPHRGVDIVSWVLAGTLRHEDDRGTVRLIKPGALWWQATGTGLVHAETNGGAGPLRFVQLTLLSAVANHGFDEPRCALVRPPLSLPDVRLLVHRSGTLRTSGSAHLYVARGRFVAAAVPPPARTMPLVEGDSVRADEPLTVEGAGELLVVSCYESPPMVPVPAALTSPMA